jgi:hypothetical protein
MQGPADGLTERLRLFAYGSSFAILCLLLLSRCDKNAAIQTHRTWRITMRSLSRFVLVVLMAWGSVHFLFAQGTDLGTIRGTVKDPSGAVIANAQVTITDLDTNIARHSNANGAGDFEVFGLRSGVYKISVTATGMNTEELNNVEVNGSKTVGVNITLRRSRRSL